MKTSQAILILILLLAVGFALGTMLQPRAFGWTHRSPSAGVLQILFGESRRMFSNHFFVEADVAFHRGYYPSIFDQARQAEENDADVTHTSETNAPPEGGFLGAPTDWIDRFGRHFKPVVHTHLQGKRVQEILPWLRISADLDPHNVRDYTVASFYLRKYLNKSDEAERFLRQGLRANPDSYEILFELGSIYCQERHDPVRARRLWELAARRWHEREDKQKQPNFKGLHDIAIELAHLEENQRNYAKAIEWLQTAMKVHSPDPKSLQKQIDQLRAKLSSTPETQALPPR